ncbi:MAG: formate dehydrogenase accessory sulfurtransferase FdhD [Deltaproteobacteria bacterium]|nr:formate dehydrogenase accessory sulfurtransferase FdhD [Deltaproteobacteria bacterium]
MEKYSENILSDRVSGTDNIKSFEITRFKDGVPAGDQHDLICEEPLLIRIHEMPYSVVMRTPGDETFHAAGFCLAEGIIDDCTDFNSIGFCADMDPNVVEVTLRPERLEKVTALLERKGFVSQTSCGICGKGFIDEISQILQYGDISKKITPDEIFRAGAKLVETQSLYKRTRGSHAIVILDKNLDVISKGEDVGRHNALDKAIGRVLMGKRLEEAFMAVLTSRISFEMIQKANRAGIYFMLSASRPTALAVELGRRLNMTLVCLSDGKDMIVFSGQERIIW